MMLKKIGMVAAGELRPGMKIGVRMNRDSATAFGPGGVIVEVGDREVLEVVTWWSGRVVGPLCSSHLGRVVEVGCWHRNGASFQLFGPAGATDCVEAA